MHRTLGLTDLYSHRDKSDHRDAGNHQATEGEGKMSTSDSNPLLFQGPLKRTTDAAMAYVRVYVVAGSTQYMTLKSDSWFDQR